jgi:mono/diheme cytochrome c family protein
MSPAFRRDGEVSQEPASSPTEFLFGFCGEEMTKGTKIVLAVGLVALVGAAIGLNWMLQRGFSARETPVALEVFIANRLRHLAVPRSRWKEVKNPFPDTPEVLAEARAHFADHCAFCHGNDGSGQVKIGQNLYPKAPDMRRSNTQSLTDGELFFIIHNGIRFTGMPAWGESGPESDPESWKLVHFIRRLPVISREELEEMEKLNPKTQRQQEEEEEIERFLQGEAPAPRSTFPHH